MTDNVYCFVKIMEKHERIIAAVQFEIKLSDFFLPIWTVYWLYLYGHYCKLLECIGQTPCLYEHYLLLL